MLNYHIMSNVDTSGTKQIRPHLGFHDSLIHDHMAYLPCFTVLHCTVEFYEVSIQAIALSNLSNFVILSFVFSVLSVCRRWLALSLFVGALLTQQQTNERTNERRRRRPTNDERRTTPTAARWLLMARHAASEHSTRRFSRPTPTTDRTTDRPTTLPSTPSYLPLQLQLQLPLPSTCRCVVVVVVVVGVLLFVSWSFVVLSVANCWLID